MFKELLSFQPRVGANLHTLTGTSLTLCWASYCKNCYHCFLSIRFCSLKWSFSKFKVVSYEVSMEIFLQNSRNQHIFLQLTTTYTWHSTMNSRCYAQGHLLRVKHFSFLHLIIQWKESLAIIASGKYLKEGRIGSPAVYIFSSDTKHWVWYKVSKSSYMSKSQDVGLPYLKHTWLRIHMLLWNFILIVQFFTQGNLVLRFLNAVGRKSALTTW